MTKLPPSRFGLLTLSVVSVLGLTACGNSSESIKPTSSAVPSPPTIPAKPTAPTTGTTVTTPATGTAPAPKPPVTTPAPTTATTTPTGNTIAPAPKPPVSGSSQKDFNTKINFDNKTIETTVKNSLEADSVKITARYWDNKKLDETFVDLNKLANGLQAIDERIHVSISAEGGQHEGTVTQKHVVYKQPYSVVAGQYFGEQKFPTPYENLSAHEKFDSVDFAGQATQILPTTGLYNYKGVVFDKDAKKGELSYAIDFATKLGKGSANINGKSAVLDEATISQFTAKHHSNGFGFTGYGIAGKASSNGESGHYDLGIFGDNAQEIAGRVEFENERFGLAGTHQK